VFSAPVVSENLSTSTITVANGASCEVVDLKSAKYASPLTLRTPRLIEALPPLLSGAGVRTV
jgi:hypothetical protein